MQRDFHTHHSANISASIVYADATTVIEYATAVMFKLAVGLPA